MFRIGKIKTQTAHNFGFLWTFDARPYYEALEISNRAQKECQAAATAYQRAHGISVIGLKQIAR